MKTRNGFVSNSSSSSFIVAFPKDFPLTKTAIHDYLFGVGEKTISAYGDGESSKKIAATVCEDMLKQKPNDPKRLKNALNGRIEGVAGYPKSNKYPKKGGESWEVDWDAYSKALHKFEAKFLSSLKERFKTDLNDLYTFGYGDDDGKYFGILEHANIFKAAKLFVRINKH